MPVKDNDNAIMVTMTLPKGAIVKSQGIPIALVADTTFNVHKDNLPIISKPEGADVAADQPPISGHSETFTPVKGADFQGIVIHESLDSLSRGGIDTQIDEVEQLIQAKGLTAPRVTPTDIEANIVSEYYFTAQDGFVGASIAKSMVHGGPSHLDAPVPLDLLTFCVLVLRNGFTVTGESACASPENFDPEIGRKIARDNAIQKVWPLMGYALKERLNCNGCGK